jgi:hypothetical protein
VSIVSLRTEIATALRSLLVSTTSSRSVEERVLALSATYGELDGENNHQYATVFARVFRTLTDDQKARLALLRRSIMSGRYADGTPFDFTICTTPFLYSAVIKDRSVLAAYEAEAEELFYQP